MSDATNGKKGVPLWLVIVFIVPMLASSVTTTASNIISKGNTDHELLLEKISVNARDIGIAIENEKEISSVNKAQSDEITKIETLLAEVVANQKNVIKILDRLERR